VVKAAGLSYDGDIRGRQQRRICDAGSQATLPALAG
jgi:hypothetical protein